MNWLAEYFAKKTASINLSMWAWPPLGIGPEGPVAPRALCLPYPGAPLAYTPGETVERHGAAWALPAHYRSTLRLVTHAVGVDAREAAPPFFRSVAIYAPSPLNEDFVVCINDAFVFVPRFAGDGSPGFSGTCMERGTPAEISPHLALPWTFHGYLTI